MMELGADLIRALPEIATAGAGTVLVVLGTFGFGRRQGWSTGFALAAFAAAFAFLFATPNGPAFGELFVVDGFARFMKGIVLIGAATTLLMAEGSRRRGRLEVFEYPALVLFSVTGMLAMASASDLMSLYLTIEAMSIPLYVLAALRRDSEQAGEAAVKYFVLGGLASAVLLYGCALLYGFTGEHSFTGLAAALSGDPPVGASVGLVLLVSGVAFKLSAAPFHMWTPDVYEGAPTPVTAFFAAAPKVAGIALFLRLLYGPMYGLAEVWEPIVAVLALLSMVVGALGALRQTNLKRLLAYGAIGHTGYALVGIASGTAAGVHGAVLYMTIYVVTTAGAFACLLAMRRDDRVFSDISDLAGLDRTHPMLAFAFAALLFSMAGIPPLAGFIAKLYVFRAAMDAGLVWLAVAGILASVVAAAYYFRIVRTMYFETGGRDFSKTIDREVRWTVAVTTGVILLFLFLAPPVIEAAAAAAAALAP